MRFVSILVVVAGILSAGAAAESIKFQRKPGIIPQNHANPVILKAEADSDAIAGDLGRGFSAVERQSALRSAGWDLRTGDRPWPLVTPRNPRVKFGFYRSSAQAPLPATDDFSNLVLRTLFERKPKGPRGRRELAESNAR